MLLIRPRLSGPLPIFGVDALHAAGNSSSSFRLDLVLNDFIYKLNCVVVLPTGVKGGL